MTGQFSNVETGGGFQISYPSGDSFVVDASIGGEEPRCCAAVFRSGNHAVKISSKYDIVDRTLICTVFAARPWTV